MKKIYMILSLVLTSAFSFSQTLAPGDIALLGINSANPDKFSFIILKDIPAGTVIQFTDNGFASPTAGRTGEGFLTFTAATAYTGGTVFTWTNGASGPSDFSSFNPTNFAFNGSGDQLFIFQGSTTNWVSQTGITLLYGINYGTALLTTGTAAATSTYVPSGLPTTSLLNLPSSTANNGYYSGSTNPTSTVFINGNPVEAYANLLDPNQWYTSASATTFPTQTVLLPLVITSFDAIKSTNGNLVSWTTANETNVQSINVERSADGRNFTALKQLGAGNSSYQFLDASPISGTNYYRLKVVDKDGSFKLSRVVAVVSNGKGTIITGVYPTITSGNITVDLSSERTQPLQFVFTDMQGRTTMVKSLTAASGNSTINLDASSLSKGLYIVKVLQGENQPATFKIVKQ